MQLSLPLTASPSIVLVRHHRARRYILRVLPDGTVRVTLPYWGSRRDALAFLERSRRWVERQQARRLGAAPQERRWRGGADVLVDGDRVQLSLAVDGDRVQVMAGERSVGSCSSAPDDLRPAVERWLRDRARRELPVELMALATQHGIRVTRVSIRDQQSRWGACSSRGTITLNWRLVQVPPFVREYVLLHELMHRRELNHSRRFWHHVRAACPRSREARTWLLTHGKSLF